MIKDLSLVLASTNYSLVSFLWSYLSGINHRIDVLNSLGMVLIILYVGLSIYGSTWDNWIIECIISSCISKLASEVAEHNEDKDAE